MTQQSMQYSRAGSYRPIVIAFSLLDFLLATIAVVASSSWAHRIVSGADVGATAQSALRARRAWSNSSR
jgi:hypothetical protein